VARERMAMSLRLWRCADGFEDFFLDRRIFQISARRSSPLLTQVVSFPVDAGVVTLVGLRSEAKKTNLIAF
jgi:hypothetical protein